MAKVMVHMNTNDYEKILAIQPMNVRIPFGKNKTMINHHNYEQYPKSGKIKIYSPIHTLQLI